MSLRPGIAAAAPLLFLMGDGAAAAQTNAPEAPKTAIKLTTVAKGLENPWALEFLPDGRMLVTERPGRLRIVDETGTVSAPLGGVPPVFARGQGGLLDVALSPGFAYDRLVYLSFAEPGLGGAGTAVARGRLGPRADPWAAVQAAARPAQWLTLKLATSLGSSSRGPTATRVSASQLIQRAGSASGGKSHSIAVGS